MRGARYWARRARDLTYSGRVVDPRTIVEATAPLRPAAFSADDTGALVTDADPAALARAEYACGPFEFVKP
jgi:hypothetical protein